MKKILIVSFIIIAIGITLYFIFGGTKNDKNGLKLIGVKKGSIVDKALAVGQIQPRKEIQIKSKISGIVKTLHVDVGQQVKAGDPLITVAPNPTPLEYAEAKRALQLSQVDFDNAQRIFKRAKEMYAKNLISRQEYETDEAQYSQSELKFKLAKEKLELLQKGVTGNGKIFSDDSHYPADRDNTAKNKYDGFSIGDHFIDFLINKFQHEKRWYP